MEMFAIILSGPAAFVLSLIYGVFLTLIVRRIEPLRILLLLPSLAILAMLLVELGFLASMGAVRARGLLGPSFEVVHLVCFFLGTPALANALILRKQPWFVGRWYVAPFLCAGFAVLLVLLQYGVSEALHGIDGNSGPYS